VPKAIGFRHRPLLGRPLLLGFHLRWSHVEGKSIERQFTTAIFRQKDKDKPNVHHDVLEMPDGQQILLTELSEGQNATVLQLPAAPRTEKEAEEQKRAEYVG